jgi:myosin heavy subunit
MPHSFLTTAVRLPPLADDTCVMADATSDKLLRALDTKLVKHPHYVAHKVVDGTFTIRHYAGDVSYSTNGERSRCADLVCAQMYSYKATQQHR